MRSAALEPGPRVIPNGSAHASRHLLQQPEVGDRPVGLAAAGGPRRRGARARRTGGRTGPAAAGTPRPGPAAGSVRTSVTSPSRASNTGKKPDSAASRATRTVSAESVPQPSGHGHQHVEVARAVHLHRRGDLALQVVQVRDGGGGDVRDPVSHRDHRQALAGAEGVADPAADRTGGGRVRGRRRRPGPLDAGVHVALVVVADEEHVVVALEHPGQAAEPDVDRAAVTRLGDDAHVVAALRLQRCRHAGRDRGGVAEQRVQPRHPPGRLGVRRREHLETSRRVDRDHPALGGAHRGVEHHPRSQRLAAAAAGPVARGDRVGALPRRTARSAPSGPAGGCRPRTCRPGTA